MIIPELRKALLTHKNQTRFSWRELSEKLNTDKTQLHKFANGNGEIGMQRIERLAKYLGYRIVKDKRRKIREH